MRFFTYLLFLLFSVVGSVTASDNPHNPVTTPIRYDGHTYMPPALTNHHTRSHINFAVGIALSASNAHMSVNNYIARVKEAILNDPIYKPLAETIAQEQIASWLLPRFSLINSTATLIDTILSGDLHHARDILQNFQVHGHIPPHAITAIEKFINRLTHLLYYDSGANFGMPKPANEVDLYWVKEIYQEYINDISKSFDVYVNQYDLNVAYYKKYEPNPHIRAQYIAQLQNYRCYDIPISTSQLVDQQNKAMLAAQFDTKFSRIDSARADMGWWTSFKSWLDFSWHDSSMVDDSLRTAITNYHNANSLAATQAQQTILATPAPLAHHVDILSPAAQKLLNSCELTSPSVHTVAPEHQPFIQRSEVVLNSAAQAHQNGTVSDAAIAETIVLTRTAQELELAGHSDEAKTLLVIAEKKWDGHSVPTTHHTGFSYMDHTLPTIYDEYEAEAAAFSSYGRVFNHAGQRIWHNVKHPGEFVTRQIDGLKNLTLLSAKSLNTFAKFLSEDEDLMREARQETRDGVVSAAQAIWEAAKHIAAMSEHEREQFFGNLIGDSVVDMVGLKGLGKVASVTKSKSTILIERTAQTFKGYKPRIPLYDKSIAKLKSFWEQKRLTTTDATIAEASSSANKVPLNSVAKSEAVVETAATSSADASKLIPSSNAPPLRALKNLKPLGRGSTGRAIPESLAEQLALQEIMSNPALGKPIGIKKGMTDPRWLQEDGWIKMGWQSENLPKSTQVHYVARCIEDVIVAIDDFKFSRTTI